MRGGNGEYILSLGEVPTGLAHVFVNGVDCGVVWCAPWEADVTSALREGENEIEIRYTNNWYNRLVGDCFLPAENRVTRSTVHYWSVPRRKPEGQSRWPLLPTIHSGPSVSDKLQPSGLLGPVRLVVRGKCAATPWLASETGSGQFNWKWALDFADRTFCKHETKGEMK